MYVSRVSDSSVNALACWASVALRPVAAAPSAGAAPSPQLVTAQMPTTATAVGAG